MEYINWGPPSEQEQKFAADCVEKVTKIAEKHIPNVTAWYDKGKR